MSNPLNLALAAIDQAFADQVKTRFAILSAAGQSDQTRLEHFCTGLKTLVDMRKRATEIVSKEIPE